MRSTTVALTTTSTTTATSTITTSRTGTGQGGGGTSSSRAGGGLEGLGGLGGSGGPRGGAPAPVPIAHLVPITANTNVCIIGSSPRIFKEDRQQADTFLHKLLTSGGTHSIQ